MINTVCEEPETQQTSSMTYLTCSCRSLRL
uniref:Uncharacterized protein n=1 Tax=Anguilla anguilla TaxID=7936 RepID=A0A0E9VZP8_ANGAN